MKCLRTGSQEYPVSFKCPLFASLKTKLTKLGPFYSSGRADATSSALNYITISRN
ncbi:hypothetical protein M2103_001694 [Ereboglobus sp. PH5-5]|nr:hypothetical protein [Ereboglobus sp. PH5-5]